MPIQLLGGWGTVGGGHVVLEASLVYSTTERASEREKLPLKAVKARCIRVASQPIYQPVDYDDNNLIYVYVVHHKLFIAGGTVGISYHPFLGEKREGRIEHV